MFSVPLEARASYTMSMSSVSIPESTVVEVVDESGLVGHGEVCMASPRFQPASNEGIRTALSVLAPTVIGFEPMHVTRIGAAMDAGRAPTSTGNRPSSRCRAC